MNNPLVSICCITYNHAPFIRQCLDGFLMQKLDLSALPSREEYEVGFEILIHDDCSTDGTTEIIKEYTAKYPDKIFPLYEEVNQYQNGKAGEIDFFNYKRARGKYIAYCEGDDYWTDPLKLQKQLEFMETHPEYSVCFHEVDTYNASTNQMYSLTKYKYESDFDVTKEMFIKQTQRVGQPLTMVFRLDKFDFDWQKHYSRYCDTVEIYHLLCQGKGRFMRFVGGQYNLQSTGVSATRTSMERSLEGCIVYSEISRYTHDPLIKKHCLEIYLWRLDVCKRNNNYKEYWQVVWYSLIKTPKLGWKVLIKAIRRRLC